MPNLRLFCTYGMHINSNLHVRCSLFISAATERLQDFTVHLSNSCNIDNHREISAYHPGYIPASGRAVLPFYGTNVATCLSIKNNKHSLYYHFLLCEVVVIGAVAAGVCIVYVGNKYFVKLIICRIS